MSRMLSWFSGLLPSRSRNVPIPENRDLDILCAAILKESTYEALTIRDHIGTEDGQNMKSQIACTRMTFEFICFFSYYAYLITVQQLSTRRWKRLSGLFYERLTRLTAEKTLQQFPSDVASQLKTEFQDSLRRTHREYAGCNRFFSTASPADDLSMIEHLSIRLNQVLHNDAFLVDQDIQMQIRTMIADFINSHEIEDVLNLKRLEQPESGRAGDSAAPDKKP